jgi:hypothetical protein
VSRKRRPSSINTISHKFKHARVKQIVETLSPYIQAVILIVQIVKAFL